MDKPWILTIGIEKFYLTEKEMKFYIDQIGKGVKYVAVSDDKILGANFQTLVHVSVIEETSKRDEGKWKCKHGRWHTKGWACTCDIKAELPQPKDNH